MANAHPRSLRWLPFVPRGMQTDINRAGFCSDWAGRWGSHRDVDRYSLGCCPAAGTGVIRGFYAAPFFRDDLIAAIGTAIEESLVCGGNNLAWSDAFSAISDFGPKSTFDFQFAITPVYSKGGISGVFDSNCQAATRICRRCQAQKHGRKNRNPHGQDPQSFHCFPSLMVRRNQPLFSTSSSFTTIVTRSDDVGTEHGMRF